ncbi:hypothetical protein BROUX41_001637 [Berkeleyomyces rouxiae]|uniref:uncharacterized protein n=1 Tax=Berkeleyomyces rouxiae TaxID=2035830 RepID=UPI003B7F85C0
MLGRPALCRSGPRHTQLTHLAASATPQRCFLQQACLAVSPRPALVQPRAAVAASTRFLSTPASLPKLHLWWRACTTSEEFAERAKWSKKDQREFCEAYPTSSRNQWRSGGQFLDVAANEIGSVICHENPLFEWSDWRQIVYTRKGFEDILIALLVDVWPHRSDPSTAFSVIDTLLRLDQQVSGQPLKSRSLGLALQEAFEQPQRKNIWNELPSAKIEKELVDCFMNHRRNPSRYTSPCTTLVGPDGVGKSYLSLQLASAQGYWVTYTSFTDHQNTEYPLRSPLADVLGSAREDQWVSYLIFQILVMQAVAQLQITPDGLAKLQYHGDFIFIARQLTKLFASISSQLTLNGDHDVTMPLKERYPAQMGLIREILHNTRVLLEDHGWNNKPLTRKTGRYHHPLRHVIVIDQAHCPTAGIDSDSLDALHRAAQALFVNLPETDPFFVLLLNNVAKTDDIPRAEYVGDTRYSDVHPPIYRIETWDIFSEQFLHLDAIKNHNGEQHNVAPLFRHGRPLWGALLASSQTSSLADVISLASSKLGWKGVGKPSKGYLLALMRAALGFNLVSPHLNQELAAHWLNYTLQANKRRDHIVTAQPSEPLIAFAAGQHLSDPHTRLSALQTLVDGVLERTVAVDNSRDMTAALVLLFAMHRTNPPDLQLPQSVRTIELLSALLGSKAIEGIRDLTKVDNIVRDSRVYFSHFTPLTRPLTPQILREAHLRGVAFYAPPDFPGGGLIIPLSVLSGSKVSILHVRTGNRPPCDVDAGFIQLESGLDQEILPGHPLEFLDSLSLVSLHLDMHPLLPSSSHQNATSGVSDLLSTETHHSSSTGNSASLLARVRSRNINVTKEATVRDLLLYAPGLSGHIYPFLAPPIEADADTLHVRMTNVAIVTALRRLYSSCDAAAKALRDDRFAGPLVDFSNRVHAMAMAGNAYKQTLLEQQRVIQEEQEAALIRMEVIRARRENKKMKKERLRYK